MSVPPVPPEPPVPPGPPDQATAPSSPTSAARGGDVLDGRYELRDVLGRGGMATVWRGHDPVLDRDVAIKIFSRADALPDAAARAAAEVRMLAGLNHPNLVSVYDAGGANPDTFDHLVMELVVGRSLRELLDDPATNALAPARVAALGAEIAAGLEHVHERGIVHRDLKPANILLERTPRGDRAKIADFGVARLLEGVQITMAGTTVGTANYLSPEQATGSGVGPASDVYSLGLVLLECLTGVTTFPGHGVAAASARLHRAPDVPASLDPAWQQLLRAMTALDPSARPSATQVAARLARIAAAADPATEVLPTDHGAVHRAESTAVLGAAPLPAGSTAVLPAGAAVPDGLRAGAAPPRRRRGLLVGIGVLVAALLVLGGVLLSGGDGASSPGEGATEPGTSTPRPPSTSPGTPAPTTSASSASSTAGRTTSSAPRAPVGPPGRPKGKGKPPKPGKGKP